MRRYEYLGRISIMSSWVRPQQILLGSIRQPTYDDLEQLAALMLDAYRGTIDYGGETFDDARAEVRSYFATSATRPLLEHSWLYVEDGTIIAASLVAFWTLHESPLIEYVMTRPTHKGRTLASWLVQRSLLSLRAAGYSEVRAVITGGNVPSERLFAHLGFLRQS